MFEIGIGHNSRKRVSEKKKPFVLQIPLDPTSPSLLDLTPQQVKDRRAQDVQDLLDKGRYNRKRPIKGPKYQPNDHMKRFDLNGRARQHWGTADDLSTAAPDDNLDERLFRTDDPLSYDPNWAIEEEAEKDEQHDDNVVSLQLYRETLEEQSLDEHVVVRNSEVYYSTSSQEHLNNLKRLNGKKGKR